MMAIRRTATSPLTNSSEFAQRAGAEQPIGGPGVLDDLPVEARVAIGMAFGPAIALEIADALAAEPSLATSGRDTGSLFWTRSRATDRN